jgi:hypothetical protein
MRRTDGRKQKGGSFEPPFLRIQSGSETRPQGLTLNFAEEAVPIPPLRPLACDFARMDTIPVFVDTSFEPGRLV